MFFLLLVNFFENKFMLIFGCRLQCIEASCLTVPLYGPLQSLRLLLGYRYDYAIHGSPYTSAHVLIENTLVQHKMAKNSRIALCCQNRVSKTLTSVMGFVLVPISLFIVPWLWC